MPQLSRRRLRLPLDARSFDQVLDTFTGAAPEIWRGNDTQVELGVFDADTLVDDIGNLQSVTFELRDTADRTATPLLSKTLSAGSLDNTVDANSWADGTKQHALIPLTNAETNLDLAGATEKTFFMVVSAITTDVPARTITLGYSLLQVREDGSGFPGTPPEGDPLYFTAAETSAAISAAVNRAVGTHRYSVLGYGAKMDGRIVYDAAITSGSPTLTSATAAFTSAHVGRKIVIQPTVSTRQVLTISAVVNSTTVTLSANASATRTGSICVWGTDDTAAVQATIDAAYAAGGGTVVLPRGICMLAGALQDTGTRNGVLLWPNPALSTSAPVTLEMEGAHLPGSNYSYTTQQPFRTGTIIYCPTAGSGTLPSVLSGTRTFGDQASAVTMALSCLTFMLPANPTMGAVNNQVGGPLRMRNVSCVIDCGVSDIPEPTHAAAVAINAPISNNNGANELESVYVIGFYAGIRGGEHTYLRNGHISFCHFGLQVYSGSGFWVYGCNVLGCTYTVHCDSNTTPCTLAVFGLETEDYIAEGDTWPWRAIVATFLDPYDLLRGYVVGLFSYAANIFDTPVGTIPSRLQINNIGRDMEQNPRPLPKVYVTKTSGQAITGGETTDITWQTERFDVGGFFASPAWTPLQHGFYQVTAHLEISAAGTVTAQLFLVINAAQYIMLDVVSGTGTLTLHGSALQLLDGITGNLRLAVYATGDVTVNDTDGRTYLQGVLLP